jgi:hypothetical protein
MVGRTWILIDIILQPWTFDDVMIVNMIRSHAIFNVWKLTKKVTGCTDSVHSNY